MNIKTVLSDFASRYLSDKQFRKLRNAYFTVRKKLSTTEQFFRGSFTTADLLEHLEQQVNEDFEILMVHSSVNAMQPMYKGTVMELLTMLTDFCGPDRTLAMPAFYFGDPAIGSLNKTLEQNPYFNMRKTPSQMGLLTELFRRSKGVCQSRHPAYRIAALGPLAKDLTTGHEFASAPAGIGSPFETMAERKTLILGIGKSFDVLTQVHFAEGSMGEEFPVPKLAEDAPEPLDVVFVEGTEEIPAKIRRNALQGRFNIFKLPSLLPKGQLQCWKFHGVPFFKIFAGEVSQTLIKAAKDGKTLYDPL